jgi:hypothetical protein
MATTRSTTPRAPAHRKTNRLPLWAAVSLAVLLGILVYGVMTPKRASDFDRPEAQVNQPANPWDPSRAY